MKILDIKREKVCAVCPYLLFNTEFFSSLLLKILLILVILESTAVEHVVACALVTQRARVRSPVGTGFLGEVFRGFSSPARQMSGNFRPPMSPNIIWPSSSSFHIRLVGMTECVLGVYCLSCLCCPGGGPGIGLITNPGRPSMSLCGQKIIYVIHSLNPSPDRSWLCKARGAWVK